MTRSVFTPRLASCRDIGDNQDPHKRFTYAHHSGGNHNNNSIRHNTPTHSHAEQPNCGESLVMETDSSGFVGRWRTESHHINRNPLNIHEMTLRWGRRKRSIGNRIYDVVRKAATPATTIDDEWTDIQVHRLKADRSVALDRTDCLLVIHYGCVGKAEGERRKRVGKGTKNGNNN